MEFISSTNNEKVKHAASLNDKKYRRLNGSFLIEGEKLVREAAFGKGKILSLYVLKGCEARFDDIIGVCQNVFVLERAAFNKISSADTPQGIIAEVKMKEVNKFEPSGPFLVLDTIQDPGNLGTIIRTAVAVDIKKIVLLSCADPYGPKVVRASSGGILSADIYQLTVEELEEEVKASQAKLYVADMNGENVFNFKIDTPRYGIVIGSEGKGVSEKLRALASRFVSLPMTKNMESLNAAVSASIIMYELKREDLA